MSQKAGQQTDLSFYNPMQNEIRNSNNNGASKTVLKRSSVMPLRGIDSSRPKDRKKKNET